MLAPELAAMATKYMEYLTLHSKSYITAEEFQARKALFADTDAFIREHNASGAKFELGHNQFSDLTDHERSLYLGYIAPAEVEEPLNPRSTKG